MIRSDDEAVKNQQSLLQRKKGEKNLRVATETH
jgi:hypothetical protein